MPCWMCQPLILDDDEYGDSVPFTGSTERGRWLLDNASGYWDAHLLAVEASRWNLAVRHACDGSELAIKAGIVFLNSTPRMVHDVVIVHQLAELVAGLPAVQAAHYEDDENWVGFVIDDDGSIALLERKRGELTQRGGALKSPSPGAVLKAELNGGVVSLLASGPPGVRRSGVRLVDDAGSRCP